MESILTVGGDECHNDRRRGGGALQQDRGQYTDHEACHRVGQQWVLREQIAGRSASQHLEGGAEQVDWANEEIEQQADGDDLENNQDHSPHLLTCTKFCGAQHKDKLLYR